MVLFSKKNLELINFYKTRIYLQELLEEYIKEGNHAFY